MPPVSRSQAKAMFAAKAGKSTLGIPKSVGAEFLASMIGHPGSVNALPDKAPPVTHIHVHIHQQSHNTPTPKRVRKPK